LTVSVLGLGSRLTLAKEATFGTASVGTYRAIPMLSESLKKTTERVVSPSLRGGFMVRSAAATRNGKTVVRGDVQTLLHDSGATLLWEAMLGKLTTTGSGPYTHTAVLQDLGADLPSYTLQVGLGGTSSSFSRKRVLGAVVESWELAASAGDPVTLGMTWVGQQAEVAEATATSGTVPSSQTYYDWRDATVTLAGLTLDCVTSFALAGNNGLNADRYCLGQALMSRPKRNTATEITGEVTIYLPADNATTSPTDVVAAMQSTSTIALAATFASGSNQVAVSATAQLQAQDYPAVDSEAELTLTIPFTVYRASDAATDANAFTVVSTNGDATA
jgi:hypothetical protein